MACGPLRRQFGPDSPQPTAAPACPTSAVRHRTCVLSCGMTLQDVRNSEMMAHLMDALDDGQDIGHYGRLVFAMVAHHFCDDDELVAQLTRDPNFAETEARSLVHQVRARDYNPPRRERILEWQSRQEFPICPNPDDPRACNVYRDLQFPDDVYEDIQDFYEEGAEEPAHQRS
jgi:hypothetical protein